MRESKLAVHCAVLLAALMLLGSSALLAQISSGTGAIQGTVTDPQGATVPGAKVVITNTATGVRAEGSTLSDGNYVFPLLVPGVYKVEIEAQGFRRVALTGVVVEVTKVTVANAKLELGLVTSEVLVVSEAAQTVDTRTATTGDVITGNLIRDLALPTRNVLDLTALQAGVSAALGNPAALGRGTPQIFVAGQRGTVNNFVLNGVDANNFGNNNFVNVPVPNPDAVQEFRVSTSQYDATQGRGSGGNINLLLRSGTSKFHGGGLWFYRSSRLDANDFFFNRSGAPKPTLQQNQFGANVGGPVPKLKETFWFFSYQGIRQKNGISGGVSGSQPVLPATRDATSLATAFNIPGGAASIDPVAVRWLNRPGPFGGLLYPSGTCAGVPGCTGPGSIGQLNFSLPSIYKEDQYNATFDRDLFHNNRVSVQFFAATVEQNNPIGGGPDLGQGQANPQKNWNSAVSDRYTLSPTLLNEFRAGFTLLKNKTLAVEGSKVSDIGMSRFNSAFFSGTPLVLFPAGTGLLSWGGISTNNDQASQNMSYTIADTLSWTRGKHTLRGGLEFRRYISNLFNNFASRGFLQFADFNNFLTGTPNDVFVGTGVTDRGFRAYDLVWFAQDDYRILRRLTLNLGVRYDFLGAPIDTRNRIGNFDPSLITAACRATGGNCLRAGFVSPEGLGGGFGTPGVSPSTLFENPKTNFAPRIGLAYDVFGNGKLAIRSGYGIYYIRTSGQTLLQLITATPFFQLFRVTGQGVIGSQALANPFPTLPTPDQFPILPIFPQFNGYSATGVPLFVNPATGLSTPLITLNPFERNLRPPYTQNWNFTVQYEFLKGWVVESGYIGSRGVRLLNGRQVNQALLVNAANPGLGGLTLNSSRNATARVSIPGFSPTGLNMVTGTGDSWYSAGILSVRHPFSRSFQIKADYTWSRSLDTNSGSFTQDLGSSPGNQLVTSSNKGLSSFDQNHRLVFTYDWDLPGPKTGWLGQILGGWSVTGVTIIQAGFAFSPVSTSGGSLAGLGATGLARANVTCSTGFTNGGGSGNVNNYVVATCFNAPAVLPNGTVLTNLTPQQGPGSQIFFIGGMGSDTTGGSLFGDAGRGILRAPTQKRADFAVRKTFPVRFMGEGGNLQFRAEFFKLFNTPTFAGPTGAPQVGIVSNINSPLFGRIIATSDQTGRVIQFGLKLNF